MSDEPTIRRTFRLAQPSFVSKLIAHGSYGEVWLLRPDPFRVFKFCAIGHHKDISAPQYRIKGLRTSEIFMVIMADNSIPHNSLRLFLRIKLVGELL